MNKQARGKLMTKENKVRQYPVDDVYTRTAMLEMSVSHINEALKNLDRKLDKQFDEIKSDIKAIKDEVKIDIKDIKKDIKFDFRFLLGAICALGAIMAHGFHWF